MAEQQTTVELLRVCINSLQFITEKYDHQPSLTIINQQNPKENAMKKRTTAIFNTS